VESVPKDEFILRIHWDLSRTLGLAHDRRADEFYLSAETAGEVRQANTLLSSRAKTPCSKISINTTNMLIQASTWILF
jgi:hypothetical protein